MTSIQRCVISILLIESAGLLATSTARADLTKHECVEANASGQHLFVAGKLTQARASFQSCAVPTCPAAVQNDCITRLDEVDRIQPSILFEAKDASGNDVADVTVTVDGAPLAKRLDGTPLRVDPGEHTFVFSMTGGPLVMKTFVLAERDQTRHERIVLGASPPTVQTPVQASVATPSTVEVRGTAPASPASGMSTLRILGLVSGGAGLVGLGVGGVFAAMAGTAQSNQQSACLSPTLCPHYTQALSDHSTYTTDSAVEVTAFVAGGVLLAAGVVMFFAGGHAEPAKTGLVIVPSFSADSRGLAIWGNF